MISLDFNTIVAIAGGIGTIAGTVVALQRIFKNLKEKEDKRRKVILDSAKKEMEQVKNDLEAKIKHIEMELHSQKESVSKDLAHLKETYSTEIKALGDKIESLRQDLTMAHQSLVTLLTQLVNKK